MQLLKLFLPIFLIATSALAYNIGDYVCVVNTGGVGVNIRSGPCTDQPVVTVLGDGCVLRVTNGPTTACGYTWYQLSNIGWAVTNYLQSCSGNKFGVGLVSPGTTTQYDLVSSMAGSQGWILLIFPGVTSKSTGPDPSWISALNSVYQRNLRPVVRIGPPWGSEYYRDMSDDSQHLVYTTLANAFATVVKGLPLPPDGVSPLYLTLDNEVDLCYEWWCQTPESVIPFQQTAKEYANFINYVINAIRALNQPRIKISAGGLAAGGNIQCGCCGSSSCSQDQGGITGLQFLQAMMSAVPGIFNKVDYFASHSYGSSGIGYGFNVPYSQAIPGLTYYQQELQIIGKNLSVLITETGWATSNPGLPSCTEQNKADWTSQAYSNIWINDPRVIGVTPFILQDSYWGDQLGYGYVLTNGQKLPVYTSIQSLRCSSGFGPC